MLTFAFSGTVQQLKALNLGARSYSKQTFTDSEEVGFCTNCKQIVGMLDVWEDNSDDGDGDEYQYSICVHCRTQTA